MENIKKSNTEDETLDEYFARSAKEKKDKINAESEAEANKQSQERANERQLLDEQRKEHLVLRQRSLVTNEDVALAKQEAEQTRKPLDQILNNLVDNRADQVINADNEKNFKNYLVSLDEGIKNRNLEKESDEQFTLYTYAKVFNVEPSLLYGLDAETMNQIKNQYIKETQRLDPSLKTPIAMRLIEKAKTNFNTEDSERNMQQMEIVSLANAIRQQKIKEIGLHSTNIMDGVKYKTYKMTLGTLGFVDGLFNVEPSSSGYYQQRYGGTRKKLENEFGANYGKKELSTIQKAMMGVVQNLEYMPRNMNKEKLGDYYQKHGLIATAQRAIIDQPDILGSLLSDAFIEALPMSRFKLLASSNKLSGMGKVVATSALVATDSYINSYADTFTFYYHQTGDFQQARQKAHLKSTVQALTASVTSRIPGINLGNKPWQQIGSGFINRQISIGYGIGGEALSSLAVGEKFDFSNIPLTYLIANLSSFGEMAVDKAPGWRAYTPKMQSDQEMLSDLSRVAKDLPIAKSNPDLVIDFVRELKASSLDGLQDVHMPTKPIKEFADKHQIDASEWVTKVTGKEGLFERAIELGIDVPISTEHYVVNVARNHGDFFDSDVKVAPNALSKRNLKEAENSFAQKQDFVNAPKKQGDSFDSEATVATDALSKRSLKEVENSFTQKQDLTDAPQKHSDSSEPEVTVAPNTLNKKGIEEVKIPSTQRRGDYESFYNSEYKKQFSFLNEGSVYRQAYQKLTEQGEHKTIASNQALLYHEFFNQLGKSLDIESTTLFNKYQLKLTADQSDSTNFIHLDKDGTIKLNFSAPINKDTFLNQTGNIFLHVLADSVDGNTHLNNQQLIKDIDSIKSWLKVPKDNNLKLLTRKQQGQWSRGFEAYLMEGKAPNAVLKGAFRRFQGWLTELYRTVRGLNVTLNDDVRGVFDRLLASKEAIEQAKRADKLFFANAEKANMSPQAFKEYQDVYKGLANDAQHRLLIRLVQQKQRENTKSWQEESLIKRKEVEQEVNSLPIYQIYDYLDKSILQDGKRGRSFKLDRQYIKKEYGSEVMKKIKHLTTSENGVSPETLADVWNYNSGKDLIKALVNMPNREQVINNEVILRMREKYGDLLATGNATNEAIKLYYTLSPARISILETEINILKKKQMVSFLKRIDVEDSFINELNLDIHTSSLTESALNETAQQVVSNLTDNEKNPDIFLTAYHEAIEKAERAAAEQNWDMALQAKESQLFNLSMYYYLINNNEGSQSFSIDENASSDITKNTLH